MRIPYTEVRPGLFRPITPVRLWGPSQSLVADGLLDSGADRTLLTPDLAQDLGIDVDALQEVVQLGSATGQLVLCRTTTLPIQIRRDGEQFCWLAEVAIPLGQIRKNHWGFRGFLEYFKVEFDGPDRAATLVPGARFPAMLPPT